MAYKQEPCPLCGRNMTAVETHPGRGELYCGHCDLTIGGNDAKTPEELIALMDSSEHRQLKAENARLRSELESVGTAAYLYGRSDLKAENAKLRELAQRMRRYMVDAVEHCGYDAQTTGYTMLGSRLEECEEAMRELGVEVE